VGHETDVTIADFVADYRAETPTAAAAAVTPNKDDLLFCVAQLFARLQSAMARTMENQQLKLDSLCNKINSPRQVITAHWQTVDYLERQLITNMERLLNNKKQQLQLYSTQLTIRNPAHEVQQIKTRLEQIVEQLVQHIKIKVNILTYQLNNNCSTLHAVSPLATLDRGYSITTKDNKVVYSSQKVQVGDAIKVRLATGSLDCDIITIS
jgi:exodeoxyribonuclease VII large subunit